RVSQTRRCTRRSASTSRITPARSSPLRRSSRRYPLSGPLARPGDAPLPVTTAGSRVRFRTNGGGLALPLVRAGAGSGECWLAPAPEFWPLRALANILSVLLAFVTAGTAARVVIRELGLPGGTWSRSYAVMKLDKITDVAIFGLSIVFVVWFHRARINAEW